MSDFPYVGPPPGGLTAAMTTARKRRLRTAGTTSGLSAMSLLVVALLVGQTGRTDLVQGPRKETPAVTTDQRTVTKDRHTTTVTVEATTTVPFSSTADTAPVPKAPAPVVPRGTVATGPVTRTQPPARHASAYAAGPITRNEGMLATTPCAVGTDTASTSDCLSAYVNPGSTAGTYQLYADVCSNDPNPVFLHYAGTSEMDFAVVDPRGHEVWRWSRWHALGPTAHTLKVDTGYCTTWTFAWTGVDANGTALPKVSGYRLRAHFLADELTTRTVPDYAFALT